MQTVKAIRHTGNESSEIDQELIAEEPLLIRVDGVPYSVVMRTPGEELPHAAGFCLGEGVVDSFDDFATVGFCKDLDPNVVDVRLKPTRRELVCDILDRKGFISQTSCGICGKELVEDLQQKMDPVASGFSASLQMVLGLTEKLLDHQSSYKATRGSHAAMILNEKLDIMSSSEDVGRHNALDKAIGKTLFDSGKGPAGVVVLSSRISYELVQKTARARIPMIVSKSRPTSLAVELGRSLNMTLACNPRENDLLVYCGNERIADL